MLEDYYGEGFHELIAGSLNDLGALLLRKGDVEAAEERFLQCLALAAELQLEVCSGVL